VPRVSFTGNLKRHVACPPADVAGATVRAALDAVFALQPQLRSYILDDQGRLRRHVNVFVNDQLVADRNGLSDAVAATDELFVFQALSGG
jgi:molybdopterin converting factor small subunit